MCHVHGGVPVNCTQRHRVTHACNRPPGPTPRGPSWLVRVTVLVGLHEGKDRRKGLLN